MSILLAAHGQGRGQGKARPLEHGPHPSTQASPGAAPHGGDRGGQPAAAAGRHAHGDHRKHGNPEDLTAYVARLEEESRAAWQQPEAVIEALGIGPGQTVCDLGAGPGYFSLRLARRVGERGRVFAVDVEPRILEVLRERIGAAALRNITPILGLSDDPLLPVASCDLILIVDTFHHFPDGVAYLRRAGRALKPGGRLANIDFHKRPLPVGPPVDHKVAREAFLAQAREAGFQVVNEPTFLPHQYFLLLRPVR